MYFKKKKMLVRKINDKFATIQDTNSTGDTCIYQGEIIEDVKTDNSTVYLPHGYGKFFEYSKNHYYKYCGNFKNGEKDGIGTEMRVFDSGLGDTEYIGEFKKNKKHGKGVFKVKKKINGQSIYDKKWIYEGDFFNGLKHGKGIEYFEGCEQKHELNYNMGFTNSMKPYSFSNKFINLEAFQYNKKIIGPAKIYNNKNELFYEGELNDVIDGNGCLYYNDFNRYTHHFTNINLQGDFKQYEFNNIYNFKGKINFISLSLDEEILFSLIPEYKDYFDNIFNKFYHKRGFQILFEGEFNLIILKLVDVVFIPNGKFTFQIKYNNNVITSGNSNINRLSKELYGCILVPYHQQNFLSFEKEKKNELDLNSSGYSSDVCESYSDDSDDSDIESNFTKVSSEMQNNLIKKYLKFKEKDVYPSGLIQNLIDKLNKEKNNISEINKILKDFNMKELIKQKKLIIESNAYIYDSDNNNKIELSYNTEHNCILSTIKKIIDSNEILAFYGINIKNHKDCILRLSYEILNNQPNNNIPNLLVFYKNKNSLDNKLSFQINYGYNQDNNRYLDYIGERKRSDRHGYGTEFWFNGNKRYEGEYRNNIYHGEGSLYEEDNNNLIFSGNFVEGAPGF